jgi:hypothetical protein
MFSVNLLVIKTGLIIYKNLIYLKGYKQEGVCEYDNNNFLIFLFKNILK